MDLGVGLYVQHSAEAVELYRAAFGLELGYHVKNRDGSYFHSELTKDGKPLLAVVEGEAPAGRNPVQLGITFPAREALESALALLKEGGEVKMPLCRLPWSPCAAEVVDRFGIDWFLSLPQQQPGDDFSPDSFETELL